MRVPVAIADELVAHATQAAPIEACALVSVVDDVARGYLTATNVSEEPSTSFELTPTTLTGWAIIAAVGVEVVLFHSHVDAPAFPSKADLRYSKPGQRLLVFSLLTADMRAFEVEAVVDADGYTEVRPHGRRRANEISLDVD